MIENEQIADGITTAAASTNPEYAREKADVDRWLTRIKEARKFDEDARRQYAIDRRYARGDSGFEVDDNILGTFIDILVAFLYARDPDLDVLPARRVQPPDMESMREAAEEFIANDPQSQMQLQQITQQAMSAGSWTGLAAGMNPAQAGAQMAEEAQRAALAEMVLVRVKQVEDAYKRRKQNEKMFAETLELVVSRLWKNGKLKGRARTCVRSGLTIAAGWIKASWQERTAKDPKVLHRISDLKDNLDKLNAQRAEMEEASGDDLDVLKADHERQLKALEAQVERVIARGFATDFVNGEDITVAPGVALPDYLDAPWISHRVPMLIDDIVAEFALEPEKKARITRFKPRKPQVRQNESAQVAGGIEPEDADGFIAAGDGEGGGGAEYGLVEEIWDRDTNTVLTTAHGLDCWLKPAQQPNATSRFYPFFGLFFGETDGQRHPQSLVTRSIKLVDDYNRMASQEAEHRRRAKPKMMFHKGMVGKDTMTQVTSGTTGEYVGVETTQPNADLRTLFFPIQYPPFDPGMYDASRIVAKLERIWGIQEALSASINTAKTATEAQIQQTGFQARTGSMRDVLEEMLSELATYTAEVALQNMSDEDVREMVGADAMWPEWQGPESLAGMVNIEIRAGSSGKPNTTAEREAWSQLLPLLQANIVQIGQLRHSSPEDIADSLEELLRITVERSGDRLDVDALVPPPGQPPMLPGPVDPANPDAPPTEQAAPAPPGAVDPMQEPIT